MNQPFIKTRTGAKISLLNPDPASIRFCDIARSLANQKRFTGYIDLVVAQHVVEASQVAMTMVPAVDRIEAGLAALIHDFSEGIFGDITSPMKRAIGGKVEEVEEGIHVAIAKRFNLVEPRERFADVVKRADMLCLYEDAIRFGMDGVVWDEEEEKFFEAPREWVPDWFESRLPKVLYSSAEAENRLTLMFNTLMVASGREAYV